MHTFIFYSEFLFPRVHTDKLHFKEWLRFLAAFNRPVLIGLLILLGSPDSIMTSIEGGQLHYTPSAAVMREDVDMLG